MLLHEVSAGNRAKRVLHASQLKYNGHVQNNIIIPILIFLHCKLIFVCLKYLDDLLHLLKCAFTEDHIEGLYIYTVSHSAMRIFRSNIL